MVAEWLTGVEFVAVNTDAQDLAKSLAPTKINLGMNITKGLGAGTDPEIGRKAAEESSDALKQMLQDSDMVFVTCGMGGGTDVYKRQVLLYTTHHYPDNHLHKTNKPVSYTHLDVYKRQATDKAIRKIGILTKDNNNFIHLVSQDNILEISSGNTDLGQANTSISAIIDKGDINVGLNGKHVADFMKIANSDRINMNFVDNTSPIVLMEPDSTVYKYVIRPVK